MINSVVDTAPSGVDLHVGGACQLHGELVYPVSSPHRVSVTVHKARQHGTAISRDHSGET